MVATARKWRPDSSRLKQWIAEEAGRASAEDMGLLQGQFAAAARRRPEQLFHPPWSELAPFDSLQLAALRADEGQEKSGDISSVWDDLVAGHLRTYCDWYGPARSYAVALVEGRASGIRFPLASGDAVVLHRVLCGYQQKVVATDLAIAHSTASKRCAQALEKLRLDRSAVPLALVVAAQSAARVITATAAKRTTFEHHGCSFVVVSVPRPRIDGGSRLTRSEQDIVRQLIEGRSRHQIASSRSTSEQTVSCQLRGIFSKLRLTGRYAAIRRASELGWFSE
jgi:DNA-binding NarL/FixJ family response regulator